MSWGKGKGRAGVTLGLPVTYTNFILTNYSTGTIHLLGGFRKVESAKTGPNDAFCVVWAIGEFFFISFVFYNY